VGTQKTLAFFPRQRLRFFRDLAQNNFYVFAPEYLPGQKIPKVALVFPNPLFFPSCDTRPARGFPLVAEHLNWLTRLPPVCSSVCDEERVLPFIAATTAFPLFFFLLSPGLSRKSPLTSAV